MKWIDLRSDTVTRPTKPMLEAMMQAEVGDDVYGEDPTVNLLEKTTARMTGMEAGLFCTSGTQSNLLALMSHCNRGDEYIVGQLAHTYRYEGGGAAVLGSIQPQPLDLEPDGSLDLAKVAHFIKPDDYHFAKTKLLCLENTQGGKVLPMDYLAKARAFVNTHGLSLHLDGARVFNAAVKLDVAVEEITRHFDTVSCCLSKGLGAPVGSVLCGPEKIIQKARRWRKVLGGGMRQAGILAAAGLYALENHVARLEKDHVNARHLAAGLAKIKGIKIDSEMVQTNIVFADITADMSKLHGHLKENRILIDPSSHLRLVTHLDIQAPDIDHAIGAFQSFFRG
ncbi:MAG: low-specificity L-threonine aldolase [Proteobacteria bacterium]|nr:low-specificity L-threonine aldolase [Desulfobacula sp.]MBU4133409.1 low-specificity L-threonine aldolase [Pseudomonadota bacterium]